MKIAAVHRNSERNFKGERLRLAALSKAEQEELLKRFDRSKRLQDSLKEWLNGSKQRLPFTGNEYNHYLKEPLRGKYYRFFSHNDKVDRLWEVQYEELK